MASITTIAPSQTLPPHKRQAFPTYNEADVTPDPHSSTWGDFFPTSQPTFTQNPGNSYPGIDATSKLALELAFAIIAIIVISGIVWRRIRFLRRHDIPLRHFVSVRPFWSSWPRKGRSTNSVRSLPRTTRPSTVPRTTLAHWSRWSAASSRSAPDPASSAIMPHPAHLYSISLFPGSALPIAAENVQIPGPSYCGGGGRGTRAVDRDDGGARRLNPRCHGEFDEWYDDKEMLPLYELSGGPPGYKEAQDRRDCPEDVMGRMYGEAPVLLSAEVDRIGESLMSSGVGGGSSSAEEGGATEGSGRTS